MGVKHWLEYSISDIADFVSAAGQPAYRAKQVWSWLHNSRVGRFDDMTNLPAAMRERMAIRGPLRALRILERRDSQDNLTSKWLLALPEAKNNPAALVECVLIVERQHSRRTVCVSSMAGCPLGCVFCATGCLGFVRNLTAGEIIEQVYMIDAFCRASPELSGVSHVVFMGMGEPLLNLDAVAAAAGAFTDPDSLGISGRHLTISTVGVPDGIRRLAEMGVNYRLALSLHAPNQRLREKLLPAAARWPLDKLMPALERFAAAASRDVTFEYCLIRGVNDRAANAKELAALAARLPAKVNLIPLNPVQGFDGAPPSHNEVNKFRQSLEDYGIKATVRVEKGGDIGAACGQLKAERMDRDKRLSS